MADNLIICDTPTAMKLYVNKYFDYDYSSDLLSKLIFIVANGSQFIINGDSERVIQNKKEFIEYLAFNYKSTVNRDVTEELILDTVNIYNVLEKYISDILIINNVWMQTMYSKHIDDYKIVLKYNN